MPLPTTAAPDHRRLELQVHVLGAPWVGAGGAQLPLSPSAATTLALLALAPHDGLSRTRMATQMFADCPEPVARRRLSTALWRLRTELRDTVGHDVLDSACPSRVALLPDVEVRVDAREFRDRVTPVLHQPAETMTPDMAAVLESAAESYRGSLLEPNYDDWVVFERDRLANLYLAVLDQLVQYHGQRRDAAKVATYAEKALVLEPLREDLHRHVMVAYQRAGRPDLASRQFELCRLALLQELGADPMPETIALHTRIMIGDGSATADDLAGLVADLERARREVLELATIVERALDAVLRLR